jgi:hypothetical protein
VRPGVLHRGAQGGGLVVLLAISVATSPGCRTRPWEIPTLGLASDADTSLDLAPSDLAAPEHGDLRHLEDLPPPPDLLLPFVCRDVYTIDSVTGMFSGFDTQKAEFFDVGVLRCPGSFGNPQTMSVARDGTAWVFFSDYTTGPTGHRQLFHVDIRTAVCAPTLFDGAQLETNAEFGSSFSSDVAGGVTDSLYLVLPGDQALARLDQRTLRLTRLGPLLEGPGELTGTGNAELWGFFPHVAGSTIYRVNKQTATLDHAIDVPQIQSGASAFAFAFWGGSFYIFLSDATVPTMTDTGVYRIDAQTGQFDTLLPHTGRQIVGAGVAACAPLGLDQ